MPVVARRYGQSGPLCGGDGRCGASRWPLAGSRPVAYASGVLGRLQDRRGDPNLRTRVMAALVILGLVVLTAPLVVVPLLGWLSGLF